MQRLQRPILINGFMATGKSTVGQRLAELSGKPFVDLDTQVEQRAGRKVAQIFAQDGEGAFRRLEAACLADLLRAGTVQVIALGGGTLATRHQRLLALDNATVISLTLPIETLLTRAAADGNERPLLSGDPTQAARLLELRQTGYAEAHEQLDADHSPDELARQALAIWQRKSTCVAAGLASYSVEVGRALAPRRVAASSGEPTLNLLITDTTVAALHAEPIRERLRSRGQRVETFCLTPGEEHKTPASLSDIWDFALRVGADRKSLVLGLGGGVATDMAGFAAATWMRGIRWLSLPTTLLGMVDASVGGKTAVDLPGAKNCVGAFWQPSRVICDIDHLKTEPERGLKGALAEVVKTALVGDATLFDLLEQRAEDVVARDWDFISELVDRCVRVKARIVSRDEREGGLRAALNLGHTVGHALEAQAGYGQLTHGEAVSLGLVAAGRIGVKLGHTSRELAERTERLLSMLQLPTDISARPLSAASALLANDKKRGGSQVRFVFATAPGQIHFEALAIDRLQQLTCSLAGA